eukprot:6965778-Prymnesium_polylepis.1
MPVKPGKMSTLWPQGLRVARCALRVARRASRVARCALCVARCAAAGLWVARCGARGGARCGVRGSRARINTLRRRVRCAAGQRRGGRACGDSECGARARAHGRARSQEREGGIIGGEVRAGGGHVVRERRAQRSATAMQQSIEPRAACVQRAESAMPRAEATERRARAPEAMTTWRGVGGAGCCRRRVDAGGAEVVRGDEAQRVIARGASHLDPGAGRVPRDHIRTRRGPRRVAQRRGERHEEERDVDDVGEVEACAKRRAEVLADALPQSDIEARLVGGVAGRRRVAAVGDQRAD